MTTKYHSEFGIYPLKNNRYTLVTALTKHTRKVMQLTKPRNHSLDFPPMKEVQQEPVRNPVQKVLDDYRTGKITLDLTEKEDE